MFVPAIIEVDPQSSPMPSSLMKCRRARRSRHTETAVELEVDGVAVKIARGADLHVIGEDVAERLDVVPTSFRVVVTRRPRYGCRGCEAAPIQAAAPSHIVDAGLPTEALVAHVLVAKYADHLPLYRQAQIYAVADTLAKLASRHSARRLNDLMPWQSATNVV